MRPPDFSSRFIIYLSERFALEQFIPLSFIFAFAVSSFNGNFSGNVFLTIFLRTVALLLFLFRLRLFDEFKDFVHDKKYYPSRPVPRGLISFREIKKLAFATLILELLISFSNGLISSIFFILALPPCLKSLLAIMWAVIC